MAAFGFLLLVSCDGSEQTAQPEAAEIYNAVDAAQEQANQESVTKVTSK